MNSFADEHRYKVAVVIDLQWPLRRHLEMLDAIQRYALANDWGVTLIPLSETAAANQKSWPFDGIIGRISDRLAKRAKRLRVPVVNVWLNSTATGIPGVFPDWELAGRMAGEHLLARGFRRFAMIGLRNDRGVARQIEGFRPSDVSGMDWFTHFVGSQYARTLPQWERFCSQLTTWAESWSTPVGVCVSEGRLARHVTDTCRQLNLSIPHDVAIVSMENEPLICASGSPTVSSIDVGYAEIGKTAAELLGSMMRGKAAPDRPILCAPNSLIMRKSTDAFAVDDLKVADSLRFIAERSHKSITVDDVASHVAMTRRSLERRFKETIDRTIAGEITRFRLERIKRLLLESDLPIKTIALRNGFRDAPRLNTVFKRELGLTPGEFRRGHSSD